MWYAFFIKLFLIYIFSHKQWQRLASPTSLSDTWSRMQNTITKLDVDGQFFSSYISEYAEEKIKPI